MVSQLSKLEQESIDYFVSFVQVLGLPKSIGQIYGLMFVTPEALAMDHVVERLEISKGSASQGLATLRALGAILPVEVPGDRRDHYRADLEVSRIVNHFFEVVLEPRIANGEDRLDRMIKLAHQENETGESETLNRLKALRKWQSRGKKAIPLVKRFLKS